MIVFWTVFVLFWSTKLSPFFWGMFFQPCPWTHFRGLRPPVLNRGVCVTMIVFWTVFVLFWSAKLSQMFREMFWGVRSCLILKHKTLANVGGDSFLGFDLVYLKVDRFVSLWRFPGLCFVLFWSIEFVSLQLFLRPQAPQKLQVDKVESKKNIPKKLARVLCFKIVYIIAQNAGEGIQKTIIVTEIHHLKFSETSGPPKLQVDKVESLKSVLKNWREFCASK